jgi:dGTPase
MPTGILLSPFACRPEQSRGRVFSEPESPTRSPFQRDRDRIIHCAAFRRLKYKTQVFVYHEGDNYRTRLSHSLEVAQIARSIARVLGLDEDLSEALSLAHDLGHTPFGHAGEDALRECMRPFGGFDHNAQSLRVVTRLESRYAAFEGLNLTWESLEGLVKHNGPLVGYSGARPLPWAILQYPQHESLELSTYASAEAQVAALSDDIAYNNHDIDDGLRAGLFTIADLEEVPLVAGVFHDVSRIYPEIGFSLTVHEAVRRLIGIMITDATEETRRRIEESGVKSAQDVRDLGRPVTAFSDAMREHDAQMKAFLFKNMYRHYKVNRMTSKARRVVRDLFTLLAAEPECLPPESYVGCDGANTPVTARKVADYIAGLTDRMALDEHRRLFDMQEKP